MLAERFSVASRSVEIGGKPYVIAEAGSNFNQSRDTALHLIDAAVAAGADAVKFQLFKASLLYPDGGPVYDVLKSVELNPAWLPSLVDHAKVAGIAFLASAFDADSLAALEDADVPAHKVASSEATNAPLLAAMARTGKPIFLATGMCDLTDVTTALTVIGSEGNRQVSLMQCCSVYPLPEEQANLRVLDTYASAFGGPLGYSDHTLGRDIAVAALARGAVTFEKHFTLDRSSPGPDHFYALEPDELTEYVATLHRIFAALGDGAKEMLPQEQAIGRRVGLHARRPIAAGARLTAEDLEVRRPATGIRARDLTLALGTVARHNIKAGEPLRWTDIRL